MTGILVIIVTKIIIIYSVIIGTSGRSGYDYKNEWEGNKLNWYGKTHSHFEQNAIINLISGLYPVHIFYRADNTEPFTYVGTGHPTPDYTTEKPVRIVWSFRRDEQIKEALFINGVYQSVLEEIIESQKSDSRKIHYLQPYSTQTIKLLAQKNQLRIIQSHFVYLLF